MTLKMAKNYLIALFFACTGIINAMKHDYNFGPSCQQVIEFYGQEKQQQKDYDKNQMMLDAMHQKLQEEQNCSICLEKKYLLESYLWTSVKPCDHKFHLDCIVKHALTGIDFTHCPNCRQKYIISNLPESVPLETKQQLQERKLLALPPLTATEKLTQFLQDSKNKISSKISSDKPYLLMGSIYTIILALGLELVYKYKLYFQGISPERLIEIQKELAGFDSCFLVAAYSILTLIAKYFGDTQAFRHGFVIATPQILYLLLRYDGYTGTKEILAWMMQLTLTHGKKFLNDKIKADAIEAYLRNVLLNISMFSGR